MAERAPERGSTVVERMTEDECRTAMREARYGRLAVSIHDAPDIFPVDIVIAGGAIYFRTASGAKLRGLNGNPVVALECDEGSARPSWSVVARGRVRQVTFPGEMSEVDRRAPEPWRFAWEYQWFHLRPSSVEGRRFQWGEASG